MLRLREAAEAKEGTVESGSGSLDVWKMSKRSHSGPTRSKLHLQKFHLREDLARMQNEDFAVARDPQAPVIAQEQLACEGSLDGGQPQTACGDRAMRALGRG